MTAINEKISTIASINRDGQKINLLGIIIHKSSVRRVQTKDGQQPCRAVFSFVLRDNINSWININYWGSPKVCGEISAGFSIGDVVLVLQGQAKVVNEGSYEDTYMFQSPSRFTVLLNELRSRVLPFSCNKKAQINKLRTELLCPVEYHLQLKQVIQQTYNNMPQTGSTQSQLLGSFNLMTQSARQPPQYFTFFAAVMKVGDMKSVILNRPPSKLPPTEIMDGSTEEGKNNPRVLHKCEITLLDESCGNLPMILWNEDLIMYALRFWKPKETVLSVVNCPVRYDTFRRGAVAVPNDRTGIITSPACEEAMRLAHYAHYASWTPITGPTPTYNTAAATGSSSSATAANSYFDQQFSQPLPITFGRIPPEVGDRNLGLDQYSFLADRYCSAVGQHQHRLFFHFQPIH